MFNNYFIVSPSLWWDNESLLKAAPKLLAAQPDANAWVYLSVGNEGKIMETDAKDFIETLRASSKKNLHTEFVALPDENHLTILHNSIYKAFKLLYSKKPG
jgi:predicted alpha/beta superfamily hydrolase